MSNYPAGYGGEPPEDWPEDWPEDLTGTGEYLVRGFQMLGKVLAASGDATPEEHEQEALSHEARMGGFPTVKQDPKTGLYDLEYSILEDARKANIFWFRAVIKAASIMVGRRGEYSGETTVDPYINFDLSGMIKGLLPGARPEEPRLSSIFDSVALKMARLIMAIRMGRVGDAEDTCLDFANYLLLLVGAGLEGFNTTPVEEDPEKSNQF